MQGNNLMQYLDEMGCADKSVIRKIIYYRHQAILTKNDCVAMNKSKPGGA